MLQEVLAGNPGDLGSELATSLLVAYISVRKKRQSCRHASFTLWQVTRIIAGSGACPRDNPLHF